VYQFRVPLLGQLGGEWGHLGASSRLDVRPIGAGAGSKMNWHLHTNSADAYSTGDTLRHYEIARPHNINHYFLVRCNGCRVANVDSIEEGIRLSEWHERSMCPTVAQEISAAVPTSDELARA
jgi:hypothetical protein